MPNGQLLNGSETAGQHGQRATSKRVAVKEMRRLQEQAYAKALKPDTSETLFCMLARTYGEMRDRIRIEKGLIRPGSRNESVRVEPKPAKRQHAPKISTLAGAAQALGIVSGPAIDVESVPKAEP